MNKRSANESNIFQTLCLMFDFILGITGSVFPDICRSKPANLI